jgi:tetratricopeptide (TPR) repeat protein
MGAEELYNEGRLAYDAGRFDEAIDWFQRSVRLQEHFKSREMLAACFTAVGATDAALENLELAWQLNEKSGKTACLLARALRDAGNFGRAREVVEAYLSHDKDYGPAKRILEALGGEHTSGGAQIRGVAICCQQFAC